MLSLQLPARKKLHSLFHLLGSCTFLCIFINALLALPLLQLRSTYPEFIQLTNYTMIAVINLAALTFIYYRTADKPKANPRDFLQHYPLFLVLFLAMSVQNSVAVIQGLSGVSSPFVRTPKSNENVAPDAYVDRKVNWITFLEIGMLVYSCFGIYLSFYLDDFFLLSFFIMFGWGLTILLYQGFKPNLNRQPRLFVPAG